MRIKKVVADKKPLFCCECPVYTTRVKIEHDECGIYKTIIKGRTANIGGRVPDERCLVIVEENGHE